MRHMEHATWMGHMEHGTMLTEEHPLRMSLCAMHTAEQCSLTDHSVSHSLTHESQLRTQGTCGKQTHSTGVVVSRSCKHSTRNPISEMCFTNPTYAERNWPANPPEPTPFDLLWLAWFLHNNPDE